MFRCKKHHPQGARHLSLAKVIIVKMSGNTLMWSIWRCGGIYYYLALVVYGVWHWSESYST